MEVQWWQNLRACLEEVRATSVPPGREVMTQAYINRIPRFIPELAGEDLTVHRWEAAHGDLYWANLTRAPLEVLDWEGRVRPGRPLRQAQVGHKSMDSAN